MNRLLRITVLLCSALFISAGIASADTLQFTLAGPVDAVFDLSSGPLSIGAGNFDTGFGFIIAPTSLTVNGMAAPMDFVGFFNGDPSAGGGVGIFESGMVMVGLAIGPQIYGGTEQNPTFAPGSFSLADATSPTPTTGQYTLTITDLTNPVSTPEPSVTVLLGVGLLAVGLAALRFKPNFGISAS
jgi:hypothetical protein